MKRRAIIVFAISFIASFLMIGKVNAQNQKFTLADTLRGSITPERAWWNVLRYDISVRPDFETKTIQGENIITYIASDLSEKRMQIDLQPPLAIDSITYQKVSKNQTQLVKLTGKDFQRLQNCYLFSIQTGTLKSRIHIYYHGKPREAVRPPWNGGWIFTRDNMGRPWMSVACQGLGASVWYPCKDHQSDEPDSGASLKITVPDSLVAVGNGRLKSTEHSSNGMATYTWVITDPINNYDIIPYIGKYVSWKETYPGLKGPLDCSYWVLDYNLDRAKIQFKQADTMLHCFEFWFGPYPFYEDGYKLVEAPHLGMEHQSAVAYGNKFANGYLGRDLSGSGWGLKWDFIIVHESGHEWFGNNITSKDLADMWVHEGFTNYTETIFTTCQFGVEAGNDYCTGTRKNIKNDRPIIGVYGVNNEGSGDMYYKGGNLLHMIRQIINDDERFREIWRGLNRDFYHQTVTTQEVENYISSKAGKDFSKIFDQYLRTVQIPVLEYQITNRVLRFRWSGCVAGFNMPLKVKAGKVQWIQPTQDWQQVELGDPSSTESFSVDRNFYIQVKKLE